MTELITQFFSDNPLLSSSGQQQTDGGNNFAANFQQYVDEYSKITPPSDTTYFVYMFLGSILTLPYSNLMASLRTRKFLLKIDGEVVHICLHQILGEKHNKLTMRTIDFTRNQQYVLFNDENVQDIIEHLDLDFDDFDNCEIDWKILTVDETLTRPFYRFVMKRMPSRELKDKFAQIAEDNFYRSAIGLDPKYSSTGLFLEFEEDIQNAELFLTHFDIYVLKKFDSLSDTMSEIFSKLHDLYKRLGNAVNLPIYAEHGYNAFVAGAIVLNLRSRYKLQCMIDSLNEEVMFKFMPIANLYQQLNLNIPIFVPSVSNSVADSGGSGHAEVEAQRLASGDDQFDLSNFANFFTDSKFGMKITPNFDHSGLPLTKFDTIEINQGMISKFLKFFDYFMSEMPVDYLKSFLYKETQYTLKTLAANNKYCLKQYLLGQLMAADTDKFERTENHLIKKYRYAYTNEMVDKLIATFALSKGRNRWILLHVYIPETEELKNAPNFLEKKLKLPNTENAEMVQIFVKLQEYGFDVNVRKEHYLRIRKVDQAQPGSFISIGTVNADTLVTFENVVSGQEPFKLIAENLKRHQDLINDNTEFKNFMKGLLVKHSVIYTKLSKFDSVIGILKKGVRPKPSFIENPLATGSEFLNALTDHNFPNEVDILRDYKLILVKLKFTESSENKEHMLKQMMRQLNSEYIKYSIVTEAKIPDFVTLVIHKNYLDAFQIKLHKTETNEAINIFYDDMFTASTSMHCFTSSRKRRNIDKSECFISWEDIEAIGGIAKHKQELHKMKIDGSKLMTYVQTKSKEKVRQMKQFLLELGFSSDRITGSNKYKALEMLKKEKIKNTLHKLGTTANIITHSLIATHIISDLMHGSYKSLEIYSLFMFGGIVSMKSAAYLERMATKLKFTNSAISKMLFTASPFVRRFTAAYNVYDLVENIKAFRVGNNDALIGIINDGTFLTVDSIEVGLVLAEGYNFAAAGTASYFFPVGAILAAAVFVGSDIYITQREMSNIDHFVYLSTLEKIYQGFRVFFGFGFSEYIEEVIEEKQLYNHLIKYGVNYLEKLPYITAYFYPSFHKHSDQYKEILNDKVILLKLQKNDPKRMQPEFDVPDGFKLMCFPDKTFANNGVNSLISQNALLKIIYGDKLPNHLNDTDLNNYNEQNSYFCNNAFGISRTTIHHESVFLIDLKNGDDFAIGEQNFKNMFLLGNGYKNITGGKKNDYFIIIGNGTSGIINGADGVNTLDLGMSYSTNEKIEIAFNSQLYQQVVISERSLYATGIQILIGRVNKSDTIQCSCELQSVVSQTYDADGDLIYVPDYHCYYKLLFKLSGNVEIQNDARYGEFTYFVTKDIQRLDIDINYNDNKNVVHRFAFDYPFTSLVNIDLKVHNDQNIITKTLKFNSRSSNNAVITIENIPPNAKYQFNDNTIFKVDNHFHAFIYTNLSIPDILQLYSFFANWLKIFLIISSNGNTTILIGHDNKHLLTNESHYSANIMHNDPFHETHFVSNDRSENVYILTCVKDEPKTLNDCQVPSVIIHDYGNGLDAKKFINTLVLSQLETQIRKFLNGTLDIKVDINNYDIVIRLSMLYSNASLYNSFFIGTVILENSLLTNSYQKLHIVNKGSIYINYNKEHNVVMFLPVPLKFDNDTTDVVITAEDVEKNTEIDIAKKFGNFTFLKVNESIIITNALTNQDYNEKESATSILLKDYVAHGVFSTLRMKFLDKTFNLGQFREKILQAQSLNEKLSEYGLSSELI